MTKFVRGPLKAALGSFVVEDADSTPLQFRPLVMQGSLLAEPVEATSSSTVMPTTTLHPILISEE